MDRLVRRVLLKSLMSLALVIPLFGVVAGVSAGPAGACVYGTRYQVISSIPVYQGSVASTGNINLWDGSPAGVKAGESSVSGRSAVFSAVIFSQKQVHLSVSAASSTGRGRLRRRVYLERTDIERRHSSSTAI